MSDWEATRLCNKLLVEVIGCDKDFFDHHEKGIKHILPLGAYNISDIAALQLDDGWYEIY